MGLSASQARLLSLTARMHSIEYKAQKLEAEKLQLANDSDEVYNTYLEALDATKLQYKVVESDGSTNYVDSSFTNLAGAGFLFKVGSTICNSYSGVIEAMDENYGVSITAADSYSLVTTLVSEGYVVLMQQSSNPESGYYYKDGKIYYQDPNDSDNLTEYELDDSVPDANSNSTGIAVYKVFEETSPSTSTKLQEVSDETGLKKAEAQYEADMNKINKKDSRYDTELSQLETEREAIQEEIDTLKTVAKDNVDRTFKLFT